MKSDWSGNGVTLGRSHEPMQELSDRPIGLQLARMKIVKRSWGHPAASDPIVWN